MRQFRNALDITVDNKTIVKGGYIQLPVPITITRDWLNDRTIIDGFDRNLDSILGPLKRFRITEKDLVSFIGKTIYAVPDDNIYYSFLEILRQDLIIDRDYIPVHVLQDFLETSEESMSVITDQYVSISDLLITRVWSYHLFKRVSPKDKYLDAYLSLCMVSSLQLLLLIAVNTPSFDFQICFSEN